jgi:hypothetical protein
MGKKVADASEESLVPVGFRVLAKADRSEPDDLRCLAGRLEQRAAVGAQIAGPCGRAHRSGQANPAALAFEMRHPAAFVGVAIDYT